MICERVNYLLFLWVLVDFQSSLVMKLEETQEQSCPAFYPVSSPLLDLMDGYLTPENFQQRCTPIFR